jgi:predicted NBD/HSP70 family sugar kinase
MPDANDTAALASMAATGRNLSGSNLERAGDHNQRVTLQAIRVCGPVTRIDLAWLTGLTSAAITNITERLLRQKLIVKAGQTRGARGQPATQLAINPDCCYSLGLNVDRDHITLVLVDFAGRVRARSSREVNFALPQAVLDFVKHSAARLISKAGVNPASLVGLGIAFPDDIQDAALPEQPPEYAIWRSVAIERLLSGVLPVPVYVENDAAAAAMGEMHFGLGQQYQSFFYLLITAGLGGGLVIDGHYFRGASGRSGEIGLLPAPGAGRLETLQHIVSLSALKQRLSEKGHAVSSPGDLTRVGAPAQAVIDEWISESGQALEQALLAIEHLIDPEAILIGGRLPAQILDQLAVILNEQLRSRRTSLAPVTVARASLADDAPAVGAAILAFSDRFLPTRLVLMKTSAQQT